MHSECRSSGLDLPEDRLLGTRDVYELVRYGLQDSFDELRPVLERMLRSSEPEVREAGARLASLALLMGQRAADLVDEALHESASHRLGVARIAFGEHRHSGVPPLVPRDPRRVVQRRRCRREGEAASCFRQLKHDALDAYGDLSAAFCDSRAFHEGTSSGCFARWTQSLSRLPGTTCLVCEKFLDRFAGEARDIRTRGVGDAFTVAKLIFRTYQQHQNDEWTSRSLALIDRLCLEGIGRRREPPRSVRAIVERTR